MGCLREYVKYGFTRLSYPSDWKVDNRRENCKGVMTDYHFDTQLNYLGNRKSKYIMFRLYRNELMIYGDGVLLGTINDPGQYRHKCNDYDDPKYVKFTNKVKRIMRYPQRYM
jgi:hypothetical protein